MSTLKSCIDCPALLDKAEAEAFFGLQVAGPMCSRFGHLLGHKGGQVVYTDAATKLASGCSSFGQPKATTPPTEISASWYTPDPNLLEVRPDNLSTCLDCANHDKAMDACAATGRVIFPERTAEEAKGCSWSFSKNLMGSNNQVGPVLASYGQATQVFVKTQTTEKKKVTRKSPPVKAHSVEPFAYSSDAPVTDEHKAKGIRAWRKHETRRGKIHYLPIFEASFFGERASLVPSSSSTSADPSLYIDHAGLLDEFAVQVYKLDLNLVIEGEPGTGKTEGVRWLAYEHQMPFTRIAYTESTEPDMVLGLYEFDPAKGTFLNPGILPEAYVQPGFVLSDEPNTPTSDAILQTYRSMNDSSRTLTVYKENFQRHDYCFHIMAMNPHWDFRNIGTRPLASADSRRLSFMWMPNPDDNMLRTIITKTVEKQDNITPDKALVDVVIKIGNDLRRMSKDGTLPDFWTVAQEIKVVRLVDDFGLEGAYRRAYFNYIAPEDAAPAMAAIKSHIPYGSDWA